MCVRFLVKNSIFWSKIRFYGQKFGFSAHLPRTPLHIRNGHGFILVYSITSSQSFKEIQSLQEKICRIKQSSKVPIVVAGNKADLEFDRQVANSNSFDKRQTNAMNMKFVEVTAKDNGQVNNLFFELLGLMKEAAKRGSGGGNVFCECTVS